MLSCGAANLDASKWQKHVTVPAELKPRTMDNARDKFFAAHALGPYLANPPEILFYSEVGSANKANAIHTLLADINFCDYDIVDMKGRYEADRSVLFYDTKVLEPAVKRNGRAEYEEGFNSAYMSCEFIHKQTNCHVQVCGVHMPKVRHKKQAQQNLAKHLNRVLEIGSKGSLPVDGVVVLGDCNATVSEWRQHPDLGPTLRGFSNVFELKNDNVYHTDGFLTAPPRRPIKEVFPFAPVRAPGSWAVHRGEESFWEFSHPAIFAGIPCDTFVPWMRHARYHMFGEW